MKLSTQAWIRTRPLMDSIIELPFNKDLNNGSLTQESLTAFLKQQIIYFNCFGKCHGILARKVPAHLSQFFWYYAEDTPRRIKECELFLKEIEGSQASTPITATLATQAYNNFQLRSVACEPTPVGVATVLACLLTYAPLRDRLSANSLPNDLLERWKQTCCLSKDATSNQEEAIHIFDETADAASPLIRNRMLAAFEKGVWHEQEFFKAVYLPHRESPNSNCFFSPTATKSCQIATQILSCCS